VAVLRGPTYHEGVQNDAGIAKLPVSSPRQQLDMLRSGRVDAALGVEQNFLVAARAMGLAAESFAPPLPLGSREVRLWLAPGRAGHPCRPRLVHALQSLRQDGSIARRMADATAED
jgi:ABC-type amino acid transport substrate-binding protein